MSLLSRTSAMSSNYVYQGCFKDDSERAIPTKMDGMVSSVEECKTLAKSNNAPLFGIQNGGECWIGNNLADAKKKGKPVVQMNNYSIFNNFDSQGNDLRTEIVEDVTQCESSCSQDPNCAGFSFGKDSKTCWYKNMSAYPVSPFFYNSGVDYYNDNTKRQIQRQGDYTEFVNIDIDPEFDILCTSTGSFDNCKSACDGDPECQAFTYGEKDKSCCLKNLSGLVSMETQGNNGTVSVNTYCGGLNGGPWNGELPENWNGAECEKTEFGGVETCDTISAFENYEIVTPNYQYSNEYPRLNDGQWGDTIDERIANCKLQCNSDVQCSGFDHDSYSNTCYFKGDSPVKSINPDAGVTWSSYFKKDRKGYVKGTCKKTGMGWVENCDTNSASALANYEVINPNYQKTDDPALYGLNDKQSGDTIDERVANCKALCNSDSRCFSFDHDTYTNKCYFKPITAERSLNTDCPDTWSSYFKKADICKKTEPSPPPKSDFTFINNPQKKTFLKNNKTFTPLRNTGVNYGENKIAYTNSANECLNICNGDPDCFGIAYDKDNDVATCWMKGNTMYPNGYPLDFSGVSDAYISNKSPLFKTSISRGNDGDFDIIPNTSMSGAEYKQMTDVSLDECKEACLADSECGGFVYTAETRNAWLQTNDMYPYTPKEQEGTNLYIKNTNNETCGRLGGFFTNQVYFGELQAYGQYQYKGQYADDGGDAFPIDAGHVDSLQECADMAEKQGAYVFGMREEDGRCFLGNNVKRAVKYGKTTSGGSQVYAKSLGTGEYVYSQDTWTTPNVEVEIKKWGELNIPMLSNLAISFTILLLRKSANARTIFSVGPLKVGLHKTDGRIVIKMNKESFSTTAEIPLDKSTRVDILFSGQVCTVYFGHEVQTSHLFASEIQDPPSDTPLLIGGENSVDFQIHSLSFSNLSRNMKCGKNRFCVGFEPDNRTYCYGLENGCGWMDGEKCATDDDCFMAFDIQSPKYTDRIITCGVDDSVSQDDAWRQDACPNTFDADSSISPPQPHLTNMNFAEKFQNMTSAPMTSFPLKKMAILGIVLLLFFFVLWFIFRKG